MKHFNSFNSFDYFFTKVKSEQMNSQPSWQVNVGTTRLDWRVAPKSWWIHCNTELLQVAVKIYMKLIEMFQFVFMYPFHNKLGFQNKWFVCSYRSISSFKRQLMLTWIQRGEAAKNVWCLFWLKNRFLEKLSKYEN